MTSETSADDQITLRPVPAAEMLVGMQPVADAFAENPHEGELDVETRLIEPGRLVNAFDGDQRIGSAAALSFRLTVPGGGEVQVAGIAAVGVRPDHRRRGIMRRMLTWQLDDARSRGEPIAILNATEAAIYQRFGFGQATTQTSFRLDPARARFRDPIAMPDGWRVRLVDIEEAVGAFASIYDQTRPTIAGSVDRTSDRWRGSLLADGNSTKRESGQKFRALLEAHGQPCAYAIYRVKPGWSPGGPDSTLLVMEVLGVDATAEQVLWQWLLSMDLIGAVRGWRGPNPHPLQLWLQEPRRLEVTVSDNPWLRILDLSTALAARTYAVPGSVVLEVGDDLIESNAGRWQLSVPGSAAGMGMAPTVTRTTGEPDLVLATAALATVYLGAFSFGDLARAGMVRECNPGALDTADLLFNTSRAPWCSTPF